MRKAPPSPSVILRIFLVIFLALIAIFSFTVEFEPSADSVKYSAGEDVLVQGKVIRIQSSESTQQLVIDDLIVDLEEKEDRVILFAPPFPEFSFGDEVSILCDLKNPEPFDGFSYDRYLASQNIYATCFSRYAPVLISSGEADSLRGILMRSRASLQEKIQMIFGEPHAALLEGLLLGEKRFSKDWDERFLRTGTTHIVAASGYNVAVVTFIVSGFLFSIGMKRQRAFAFLIASIFGYVMLAGAEAAVVRAGVMGALILLSRQLGRRASMLNVILLTASIMLFINPKLLRDDVGFQLSMLSTIGLIYFTPILNKKFKFIPEDFAIRESVTATVAATIFTLPIIFLSFGRLSIVGPFVNMLVLPIIPSAMLLGGIAVAASFLSVQIGIILSAPAWALLSLILIIVKSISTLPIASFAIGGLLSIFFAILSSILLIVLWRLLINNSGKKV